jgi:hypothetical protein
VLSSNVQEYSRGCKHQVNPATLLQNNVYALLAVSVNIQEKQSDHRWHRKQNHLLGCCVSDSLADNDANIEESMPQNRVRETDRKRGAGERCQGTDWER